MTDLVNICDVCSEIFAGGDAPRNNMSTEKTEEYNIPIYSNGEANDGLYGFTNFARVSEPSITVSARGTIGYTAIRTSPFVPIVRLITLVPKQELIDIKYLYYAIQNYKFGGSGTSIPQLTVPELKKYCFPLHTLEKQQQIVSVLDKVSDLINKRKEQLNKLDELVKARFVELFGEVETLIHRWNVKRFSEVTNNLDSTRKPVKDADRKKMQGEYPYYGATGIVDYVNDYRIDGIFLLISEDGKALEFRNKDIAFIASGKIWVNNHAHVLQCTEDVDMVFLMYYMNLRNISDWVTGIDQKKLNRANMDMISVGVPPIELQKQFASFVEQTDKSKFAVQKALDEAQTLFDSLMQEFFG